MQVWACNSHFTVQEQQCITNVCVSLNLSSSPHIPEFCQAPLALCRTRCFGLELWTSRPECSAAGGLKSAPNSRLQYIRVSYRLLPFLPFPVSQRHIKMRGYTWELGCLVVPDVLLGFRF